MKLFVTESSFMTKHAIKLNQLLRSSILRKLLLVYTQDLLR